MAQLRLALVVFSVIYSVAWFAFATAADSPYFAGKTIRIVVGFKPGGGTDLQARYFASGWSRFIPGSPKILVSNLPPNIAATNYVWKAKADGLTLEFRASGPVTSQFDKHAQFKADQLKWIGVHAARDTVWLVRGTAPYARLEECATKKVGEPLLITSRDLENVSGKWLSALALAMWKRCSIKVLAVGRMGTADDLLMIERGETHSFIAGSEWYALPKLRPGWIKSGYLRAFADMSHPETPIQPNAEAKFEVPNAIELLTPEQKKIWESVHLPDNFVGKGIVASPGTPEEILVTLRKAYEDAAKDREFKAGLEKIMGQPLSLIRAPRLEELTRHYQEVFKPELEDKLRQDVLQFIGYKK
jgi:tripartite-type tricarboxylate transporter receptor subunit TctC